MNFRNKKHKSLEISLTPMIDVVFLLLIFFMVTTTFSKNTIIKVILPQAEGQPVEQQKQILTLTIDKSGQYFIDDISLGDKSLDTLEKALTAYKGNKNIPLIINSDASAPVQAAISVLDVASKIGFKNITFATQK
ncbi:biopolymer transport protein ExbD [Bathymodiolus platifrons methanotrophic gill symbiont]|uniref:ExbD/TolR family protein n=1 Tax=Bathymodiolus platifrons methanotrophic gill symbiont TaxID=113268 RepID=UPI0011C9C4DB|nr:biopolymer transporter ExbD [Bathymodiolus platifrons methanotrophic gill symbiont]TXK97030.1 biopolymer transporter ExbD [Methylococcaceae bacterium HT1]TXL16541.1 biopolymer transporter ExbD [Methylococcaceae bacterium HT3]TXL22397.1 biopolymer transporter ExbD [Methylococcaceae bacterium HT2]GFO74842.1 biopolymer transport protein ExbD [Bathymodiolus platifrons methanotrophic gill symbiont]